MNHKKKWFINDDVGGSLRKYGEIISWLRVMGCFDGSVFENIPNLNYFGDGYPLLEVEVVIPSKKSAKFVITKSSLYMIACSIRNLRFQFKAEFDIDSFTILEDYGGKYTSKPWEYVGPKNMIAAIDQLYAMNNNIDMREKVVMKPYVEACEVFYVHLCEAARLYVVESLVCRTLESDFTVEVFENPTYRQEAGRLLEGKGGEKVAVIEDVYSLVKGNRPLDSNRSDGPPVNIKNFINSYKKMSKAWLTYSLSERKVFQMNPNDVSMLNMRSIKSLRCSLGVMCNTNLNKILKYWKKKSGKDQPEMTAKEYGDMEKRVRELQDQKRVFDSDMEKQKKVLNS